MQIRLGGGRKDGHNNSTTREQHSVTAEVQFETFDEKLTVKSEATTR